MAVQIPHGKGQIFGENGRPIVKYRDTLGIHVLDRDPDPPWEGAILRERASVCKV